MNKHTCNTDAMKRSFCATATEIQDLDKILKVL